MTRDDDVGDLVEGRRLEAVKNHERQGGQPHRFGIAGNEAMEWAGLVDIQCLDAGPRPLDSSLPRLAVERDVARAEVRQDAGFPKE